MNANILNLVLPENCRIICISDIHGSLEPLKALLKKCCLKQEDYLIFLGDYIEKGNDSYGALEYIKYLYETRKNTYFIKGNVDLNPTTILNECNDESALQYLFRRKSILKQWAQKSGLPEINSKNVNEIRKILFNEYQEDINFLARLPVAVLTQDFIFIHVGLDGNTLKGSDRDVLYNAPGLLIDGENPDGRWIIFGHYPVFNSPLAGNSHNPIVFKDRKVIAIDGGSALIQHGQLNAFIINKNGRNFDFNYEFSNDLEIRKIIKNYHAENDNMPVFKCEPAPYQIIQDEKYFYTCKALKTGAVGRIKKELLLKDQNGTYYLYDNNNISGFLSVEKGENVYIINNNCEGYALVKNRMGFMGWVRKDCL